MEFDGRTPPPPSPLVWLAAIDRMSERSVFPWRGALAVDAQGALIIDGVMPGRYVARRRTASQPMVASGR